MQLSFKELKKKDVINILDARCLGRITDVVFRFPEGLLCAIIVPGRKKSKFSFFDKSQIVIEHNKIVKIGNDVILVKINCGNCFSQEVNCLPPDKNKKCSPSNPCEPFKKFSDNVSSEDY